ncbi:hypothetical protein ACFY20_08845 [Streptomyces sp. NPDC001312]|uniref:hypothetical protein n=1 Tax=Streptomyces sp. NPDC001312 TaxID=3364561 RepID=UPI003697507F
MATEYCMRTVDFRPAPAGWRIVWLTDSGVDIAPMPGWIVREELECERGRSTGYRDVVATRVEDHGAEPISLGTDVNFWYVLGPGEPEPTLEAAAAERERRALRGIS